MVTVNFEWNYHNGHTDFIKRKGKNGRGSNLNGVKLSEKKIWLLGCGDLAKSLYPLLLPFTKDINVYDPWIPKKKIKQLGFKLMSLNEMFKKCEINYVWAAVTTKNKNLINKKLLNKLKYKSLCMLMSRDNEVNFINLIKRVKKGEIFVANDVCTKEQ